MKRKFRRRKDVRSRGVCTLLPMLRRRLFHTCTDREKLIKQIRAGLVGPAASQLRTRKTGNATKLLTHFSSTKNIYNWNLNTTYLFISLVLSQSTIITC